MESSCSRFTAAEGGARLAAAAAEKNILVVEHTAFISTRLLYEDAYKIRGKLSAGRQRSVHVTRASRVDILAYDYRALTDLQLVAAHKYEDVVDWRQEVEDGEVLVCTSEVLKRLLEERILSMQDLNILIIDSCHVIYKDDNLKYILKQYKMCEQDSQPRILALTYPLFSSMKGDSNHKQNSENATSSADSGDTTENDTKTDDKSELSIDNKDAMPDTNSDDNLKTINDTENKNTEVIDKSEINTINDKEADKKVNDSKINEADKSNVTSESDDVEANTDNRKETETKAIDNEASTDKKNPEESAEKVENEIGVYKNYDDFAMYEQLEWKIEELERELCCQMDLAEDIDGGKRLSMSVTKLMELIIEHSPRPPLDQLPEPYVELERFMREAVDDAMAFLYEHRYDLTEIYGEDMYDEVKDIPDPRIVPKHLFRQFLYILDELGPYSADKAAFSLLMKLETLRIKTPYERHFLLLRLCTTVFVKIRCYADYIFSSYPSDWDKIKYFSTPKVLRLVEILEKFKPDTPNDGLNKNSKVDSTAKMLSDIDKCDFVTLSNKIEDRVNTIESNLKEIVLDSESDCKVDSKNDSAINSLDSVDNSLNNVVDSHGNRLDSDKSKRDIVSDGGSFDRDGCRLDSCGNTLNSDGNTLNISGSRPDCCGNTFNGSGNTVNSGGTKLDSEKGDPLWPSRRTGPRSRGRGRQARSNAGRVQQQQQNPDALCGVMFMNEPLMAKIMFYLIVDMSRCNPALSYLHAQYCAADSESSEPRDCQRQGKKQEDVLKKFRMHECNLLLATSALEEGIDLPRCNLVLRWDMPSSYRSHAACRGRARAARAAAAAVCAKNEASKLLRYVAVYRELDQIISRKCGCGIQDEPPQTEEDHADSLTFLIKPYTPQDKQEKTSKTTLQIEQKDVEKERTLNDRLQVSDANVEKIILEKDTNTPKLATDTALHIEEKERTSNDRLQIVSNINVEADTVLERDANTPNLDVRLDVKSINNDQESLKDNTNIDKSNVSLVNGIESKDIPRDNQDKAKAILPNDAKIDELIAKNGIIECRSKAVKINETLNGYIDQGVTNINNANNVTNKFEINHSDVKHQFDNANSDNELCNILENVNKNDSNTLVTDNNEQIEIDVAKENILGDNIDDNTKEYNQSDLKVDVVTDSGLNNLNSYSKSDINDRNECVSDGRHSVAVNKGGSGTKCDGRREKATDSNAASVDLSTAIPLINRYCAKLPSDTFTRLAPQWWMEEVQLPVQGGKETRPAYICTLRLPLNCPVKYNIVGHPMPTRVLARRMVALQACRILHKSGELDNQLMPIGKENFKATELESTVGCLNGDTNDPNDAARPGTTKRRQYYYKRTAWAFTDCQPVIDTSDSEIDSSAATNAGPDNQPADTKGNKSGKRNMLYAIVSKLWCALPERYNTRGRRLHAPQNAAQALGILMAREHPDRLQIPPFPVYTRSGEVRVWVEYVPDADVRLSPRRAKLVRRFMRFVFAEVLRVQRRGMRLQADGGTSNNYYIVPTIKSTKEDGSVHIDIDWSFLELIYQHTEQKEHAEIEKPLLFPEKEGDGKSGEKERDGEKVKKMDNPLLKPGEVFHFDPEKYKEAVVTPWYRNQDQPQFFLVAEICWNLNPDSAFPSATHASFRDYYSSKYGVTLTQSDQPLLDVDHTSARLNLLTPRYVNRKGVALPVSSERTRRAKRDRLDQKQILVPELSRRHPFAAPLWFAAVALPCVLYRINALLIADEIRRAVAIDVGLGIPKIDDDKYPGFQWPPLDFGWSLAEVLNADSEKSEKKTDEEDTALKEETKTEESNVKEERENSTEDHSTEEPKEKTANDILQEKEDAENTFEIGMWSNEMASNIQTTEYNEYLEPLPSNLTLCTSASGGVDWTERTKRQFNPTRPLSVADSDCSYMSSEFDTDETDSDVSDENDGSYLSPMSYRIEYKTAHEAEAFDVERKKVNPAPLPDAEDDAADREAHDALVRVGNAPKEYIEKFHRAVASHEKEIVDRGYLIKHDEPIKTILPENNTQKVATADEKDASKLLEMFPYSSDKIEFTDGQINVESVEKNKRFLLAELKKSLSTDEVKKLKCFSMVDVDIDSEDYVNEKVVNVGFDTKESYVERISKWDSVKEFKPYFEEGRAQSGKPFDFDYQPELEGHPGPSPSVILQALTMSNANDGINLERLETIGDSFLKFAITAYLYCAHPTVHEGKLSHMRSVEFEPVPAGSLPAAGCSHDREQVRAARQLAAALPPPAAHAASPPSPTGRFTGASCPGATVRRVRLLHTVQPDHSAQYTR
ncbi:endoribonuclease Dcr-1 isoform X2 [Galleria mellonella]|uniref:Endoribonuclease Dcr-1 isoform X2 n=1 Tax=Galleria mellonella TaxID=7137 RepID=A0ABM3MAE2_GALME|nr:endoribonuclease Dcr-1 isoform X2 [Galleria mellonella]